MNRSAENIVSGASLVSTELPVDMALDGRRPVLLDHGSRHHLFRIESGDVVPDLPASAGRGINFIAVGTDGTLASARSRSDFSSAAQATRWIERLARFVAGPAPHWQMAELPEGEARLSPNECARGPMRGLLWLTVEHGDVSLMGLAVSHAAVAGYSG